MEVTDCLFYPGIKGFQDRTEISPLVLDSSMLFSSFHDPERDMIYMPHDQFPTAMIPSTSGILEIRVRQPISKHMVKRDMDFCLDPVFSLCHRPPETVLLYSLHDGILSKDVILGLDYTSFRLHLICHLFPRDCPLFHLHLHFLGQLFSAIHGKIVLGIVRLHEPRVYDLSDWITTQQRNHPQAEFHILRLENQPELGEMTTFPSMMELVRSRSPKEYTFYCHSKGIKKRNDSFIALWCELMYKLSFASFDVMMFHEKDADMGGILRSRWQLRKISRRVPWHYSGTFFWFHHRLFQRYRAAMLEQDFYGVEFWPSTICSEERALCFRFDRSCGMYQENRHYHRTNIPSIFHLLRDPLSFGVISHFPLSFSLGYRQKIPRSQELNDR